MRSAFCRSRVMSDGVTLCVTLVTAPSSRFRTR